MIEKFNEVVLLGFRESESAALAAALDRHAARVSPDRERLPEADALVIQLGEPVGRSLIDQLPRLRYLVVYGTDYSRIDLAHAAARGVTVANVPGYSTDSVAEMVFAALLEQLRDLERMKAQARRRNFDDLALGGTLSGKELGVVGLRRIGRRTAEIAHAFGARVCYFSRTRNPSFRYAELPDLVASCDFVATHLPATAATTRLFDSRILRRIKPGSIWVHLSPIQIFDFQSLCARLERRDWTFIFDHSDELSPAQLDQLERHDCCIIYPPVACVTAEAQRQKLGILVANLESFLSGRPANKIQPE